jgi:hypothetical protein
MRAFSLSCGFWCPDMDMGWVLTLICQRGCTEGRKEPFYLAILVRPSYQSLTHPRPTLIAPFLDDRAIARAKGEGDVEVDIEISDFGMDDEGEDSKDVIMIMSRRRKGGVRMKMKGLSMGPPLKGSSRGGVVGAGAGLSSSVPAPTDSISTNESNTPATTTNATTTRTSTNAGAPVPPKPAPAPHSAPEPPTSP